MPGRTGSSASIEMDVRSKADVKSLLGEKVFCPTHIDIQSISEINTRQSSAKSCESMTTNSFGKASFTLVS